MRSAIYLFPAILLLAACKRDETTSAPKAVEVEESAVATNESAAAPRAVVIPEDGVVPRAVVIPGEGQVVVAKKPVGPREPRKRRPQVVDKVEQGLETAGQKTREAAATAEAHAGEALGIAREKTETGLRTAADATGKFLQRTGEKIEESAQDAQEP